MNEKDILFSVGFDRKWGGFDFGVRGDITELSSGDMDKFRATIIVAIGTMEDMWRRGREEENKAQQSSLL